MSLLPLPGRSRPSHLYRTLVEVIRQGEPDPQGMALIIEQLGTRGDLPRDEVSSLLAMLPQPVSVR